MKNGQRDSCTNVISDTQNHNLCSVGFEKSVTEICATKDEHCINGSWNEYNECIPRDDCTLRDHKFEPCDARYMEIVNENYISPPAMEIVSFHIPMDAVSASSSLDNSYNIFAIAIGAVLLVATIAEICRRCCKNEGNKIDAILQILINNKFFFFIY